MNRLLGQVAAFFDSISPIERIRLAKQSASLKAQLNEERAKEKPNQIALLKLAKERIRLRELLGFGKPGVSAKPVDAVKFYPEEQRRTKGQRQKDNDAALEMMARIQHEGRPATEAEKATLARFSGYGGGLHDKANDLYGSDYEYYTPTPIAAGMWSLLDEMGFKGGRVLDPSSGTGVFAATRPRSAVIDQVELSEQSGGINKLVNDDETSKVTISPFEAVAASTPDETYDAVVTNVPFGSASARGANAGKDSKWSNESLEYYFMLRSMDKLKPGGLASFIVPPRIVSGKGGKDEELRYQLSLRAEFMGAYRLPNRVFQDASDADTITDVVVFRKHSRDGREKVSELAAENVQSLIDANVLWQEFIQGDYFKGEGRRFMLGEFQAKDPAKFRDVDRVISDQSTANIAKLLRKFPGSRIDWAALDATESAPILYSEGDILYQDGRTLQYRDGQFVLIASTVDHGAMEATATELRSALSAVESGADWPKASGFLKYLEMHDKADEIPPWLLQVNGACSKMPAGEAAGWFVALAAGMAAIEVRNIHAPSGAFDYLTRYAKLSEVIKENASYARKSAGNLRPAARAARNQLGTVYGRAGGFAGWWRGEAGTLDRTLSADQQFEQIKYNEADDLGFVPISRVSEVYGEDADPFASDDWVVSPDGQNAAKASDYYYGGYADFLRRNERDLAEATDPKVRDKLLRQREAAKAHLVVPDVERMTFNLHSPYVPLDKKLEFLREYVDPRFEIAAEVRTVGGEEEATGRMVIDFPTKYVNKGGRRERALRRIAVTYLKTGNLSTGKTENTADWNAKEDAALLAEMREMTSAMNSRFNNWSKSNREMREAIKAKMHAPENLFFEWQDDETPLTIPGMHPDLSLHGYQNAEVRRQGKKFGGVNGFGVGLGKTFTALASVQHAQSIGVKKKTFFVVPNTVLSNWRKEALIGRGKPGDENYSPPAYASGDDCLFVGLDVSEDGKAEVNASNYARDLNRILENAHSKIFMTLEAFALIPMKEVTLERYQDFIAAVDPSFAESKRKRDEAVDEKRKRSDVERADAKKAKLVAVGEKSAAVPYFEDMGCDSLVFDEAHQMKNSKLLLEFQSAKYLAGATVSQRGLDAQVKAWFVRGGSARGDGVLALTATPITNSPLEIYSMLSLAVGEEEINRRLMIQGGDDFMNAFSDVAHLEEPDLVGQMRAGRVFMGLQNVNMLRGALRQIANIKSAEEVGNAVELPEENPIKTAVELDSDSRKRLQQLKTVYRYAKQYLNDPDSLLPEQVEVLEKFAEETGESIDLLGHPFNLINKMANLIVDKDMENGVLSLTFLAPEKDKAEKLIALFNKKGIKEKRNRPGRMTKRENVTIKTKKGTDGEADKIEYTVKVEAWIDADRIVVDSTDYNTHEAFFDMASKSGLNLDVKLSPKLAAFLANAQKELATPKAGKHSKQIVFCDMLGMHMKLKHLLVTKCGVPANKVAIINAKAISDPADMQDVQDGFNADGDENRYSFVIANKKAEVGINLQRGTQAMHHLTIGWTPDSLTQRNGRGVRQGNYLRSVNVYHYDANGTFDEYKRMLVGKKNDWISAVMKEDAEGDSIRITGGLSDKELDDLLESTGDAEAMARAKDRIEQREREQATAISREAQVQSLRVLEGHLQWKARYKTPLDYYLQKAEQHLDLTYQLAGIRSKLRTAKAPTVIAKLKAQEQLLSGKVDQLAAILSNSALDWNKNVISGLGYREAQRGGLDKYGQPTGIAEGSPLHKRYMQELEDIDSAIEQVKSEYKRQSKRFGAFSDTALEQFQSGNGSIIGGKLILAGMFARIDDELWVVSGKAEMVNPKTGKKREIASGGELNLVGPSDSDELWQPVAKEAAAHDAAVIAAGNDEGFSAGDTRLYSTFSREVYAMLDVKPKATFMLAGNIALAAPLYPRPIPPSAVGGALVAKAKKDQDGLFEWKGDRFVRFVGEIPAMAGQFGQPHAELVKYAIAHNLKLSKADWDVLGSGDTYYFGQLTAGARAQREAFFSGFTATLVELAAVAKTGEELDSMATDRVREALDFIDFGDGWAVTSFLSKGQLEEITKAKERIATGGKPVVWLEDLISKYSTLRSAAASWIADRIIANPEQFVFERTSMIEPESGLILACENVIDGDDEPALLADAQTLAPEFVRFIVERQKETYGKDMEPGAVLYWRGTLPADLRSAFLTGYGKGGYLRDLARKAVAAYIAASAIKDSAGDEAGKVIERLNDIASVESVELLDQDVSRPGSKWSGAYVYKANQCIKVKMGWGADGKRLKDREAGLKGRFWWSDGGCWLMTLADAERDERGDKVASASDLLKFLGAEVAA